MLAHCWKASPPISLMLVERTTSLSELHPSNVLLGTEETLVGNSKYSIDLHPLKMPLPIFLMPVGRLTVFRLLQFSKAPLGISLILSGSVISAMLEHPLKMSLPILVTVRGMDTDVSPGQLENAPEAISSTKKVMESTVIFSGITMSPRYGSVFFTTVADSFFAFS